MTYVGQPTSGEYSRQYADVPEEKQIATNIINIPYLFDYKPSDFYTN